MNAKQRAAALAKARIDEKFELSQLHIRRKDKVVSTIEEAGGLKKGQRMYLALCWHQRRVWKCPVRNVIDKSRQTGVSTVVELLQYRKAKREGVGAVVVAHKTKAAQRLFAMFERAWRRDKHEKPKLSKEKFSDGWIVMADGEGGIEVTTAESPDAIRSGTYQSVHGSEVAYWGSNGPALDAAIQQTVPLILDGKLYADSQIDYESTPCGEDDIFHPMWTNAAKHCRLRFIENDKSSCPYGFDVEREIDDPDGEWNRFHPFYISALDDDDCYLPLDPGEEERIFSNLTEEEEWILREGGKLGHFPRTEDELLQFVKARRLILQTRCRGDLKKLHTEYSVTPEQGFAATGDHRFDVDRLARAPIVKPLRGFLRTRERWSNRVEFVSEPFGDVYVYQRPKPQGRYVVYTDTSKGVECDDGTCPWCGGSSDSSCSQVLDADTWEQCAVLWGKLGEEDLVEPVKCLGIWYCWAFQGVETQGGFGEHLIQQLAKSYPSDRIFREHGRREFGLRVHSGNRVSLISDLAAVFHEGALILRDERTVHQMRQFKKPRGGRYEHSKGHHDDCVSALWGAVRIARDLPPHFMSMPDERLAGMRPEPFGERFSQRRRPTNPNDYGYY